MQRRTSNEITDQEIEYVNEEVGVPVGLMRGVAHTANAWALESYNADLCHNLDRALIEAGQKGEACEALRRGLGLHRDHPGLLRELQRIGARRCPVLPFLPRSSYLNVWLGRLRHHILG